MLDVQYDPLQIESERSLSKIVSPLAVMVSKLASHTLLDQDDRDELSSREFAFPKQRKEPIEDAKHVRVAIARFNQVKDVSDDERDDAWKRIKTAAKKHGVEISEKSWREIGKS